MNLNKYSELAKRTRPENNDRLLPNWAISLVEEAGEVAGPIKKFLFHGHTYEGTHQKVRDELGDLLWYIDSIREYFGFTWEEILQGNIDKLKRRYPQGFSEKESREREEERTCETCWARNYDSDVPLCSECLSTPGRTKWSPRKESK